MSTATIGEDGVTYDLIETESTEVRVVLNVPAYLCTEDELRGRIVNALGEVKGITVESIEVNPVITYRKGEEHAGQV